ncbi:hypothetical protein S58_69160 [Bradyrhizobium oligotrophicum S58]|uniref:Uncharacterized protein n=1 Tax=Bradyrhizobium oligotrophicum S58 TaxID=1245469 RepID=M4ZGA6_9BRAD|nr:hypothetical protein [Bradyrhizobium oligotrophicum]BAM92882.1 hypothetical protein S58_69160 [Bradyrhizobium oligotrophicum S58]
MDPEALYHQLGHLVATMPNLNGGDWKTPEGQRWLGRAAVLVQALGANSADIAAFNVASNNLGTGLHTQNVQARPGPCEEPARSYNHHRRRGRLDAWTLTQSLKDFAARSPATIVKVDAETAALKVSAYGAIWQTAAAL